MTSSYLFLLEQFKICSYLLYSSSSMSNISLNSLMKNIYFFKILSILLDLRRCDISKVQSQTRSASTIVSFDRMSISFQYLSESNFIKFNKFFLKQSNHDRQWKRLRNPSASKPSWMWAYRSFLLDTSSLRSSGPTPTAAESESVAFPLSTSAPPPATPSQPSPALPGTGAPSRWSTTGSPHGSWRK